MKFTQRRIEEFACPPGRKDVLKFDGHLGVRVTNAGQTGSLAGKFYLTQYSLAGAKRRIPLGSCDAISLAAAREATKPLLGDFAKGRDPAADRKDAALRADRKAAHDALTLEALLEQWDALHLADRRERYRAESVRAIKLAFGQSLKVPAADLSRSAVVRVLDGLARDGKPAMASRTAAYGRAAYHWAVKRGSLAVNPFANLPQAPLARRERVLADEELRAVWRATEEPGPFDAIVRMLILTGQRREEAAGMTWHELDADLSTWSIPGSRAKNGITHIVPLPSQAQALLRTQPRHEGKSLVFPGERGVFSGWSKSKDRLDQRCGVSDWTLHDLRRTAATGLQKLGVRLEVTEAVLNHVAGSRAGIVGVYQRHHWADEKRTALAAWGEHVAAIIEDREAADNVTEFGARAKQRTRIVLR
jgi:integrase